MHIVASNRAVLFAALTGNEIIQSGVIELSGAIAASVTLVAEESENAYLGKLAGKTGAEPLPARGEKVEAGKIYAYNGGMVMARQDHIRTEHAPEDVLALFVVYRADAEALLPWVAGEKVERGIRRTYGGKTWSVIQGHVTQADWTPDKVPALWAEYVEAPPPQTIPDWRSGEALTYVAPKNGANANLPTSDWPEAIYRMHKGLKYRLRQNPGANIWEPQTVPAIWLAIP